MLVSESEKLRNLPASERSALSADVRAVKRRMIQHILPPGYIARDDGSVISSDGRVIILPEMVAARVKDLPTLSDKLSFVDTIPTDHGNLDTSGK